MTQGEDYVREAKLLRVVDGDTLDLEIDLGFKCYQHIRVRLKGVNTPEIYGVKKGSVEYTAGLIASDATKEWFEVHAPDGQILVKTYKTGKYGRWLATIRDLDTENHLNEHLDALGYGEEEQ
jgi:micrococcal nuclease